MSREEELKQLLSNYIEKYNFKVSRVLMFMWKDHSILNIGEAHLDRIRQAFFPCIIQLISTYASKEDIIALELPNSQQENINKYLYSNESDAKEIMSQLQQEVIIRPFSKIFEIARKKCMGVIFMDKRKKNNYGNTKKVNAQFIEAVEEIYGDIDRNKKKIIFYSGSAHSAYTIYGHTLGDQLRKRVGRNKISSFRLRNYQSTFVWLNNNDEFEGDRFLIDDILEKYLGQAISLHYNDRLFRQLFSFEHTGKTRPMNEICDWLIYY